MINTAATLIIVFKKYFRELLWTLIGVNVYCETGLSLMIQDASCAR